MLIKKDMKIFNLNITPGRDQLVYFVILLVIGSYIGYKMAPIKYCNSFGSCVASDPLLYTLGGFFFVLILGFILITIYNNFE